MYRKSDPNQRETRTGRTSNSMAPANMLGVSGYRPNENSMRDSIFSQGVMEVPGGQRNGPVAQGSRFDASGYRPNDRSMRDSIFSQGGMEVPNGQRNGPVAQGSRFDASGYRPENRSLNTRGAAGVDREASNDAEVLQSQGTLQAGNTRDGVRPEGPGGRVSLSNQLDNMLNRLRNLPSMGTGPEGPRREQPLGTDQEVTLQCIEKRVVSSPSFSYNSTLALDVHPDLEHHQLWAILNFIKSSSISRTMKQLF